MRVREITLKGVLIINMTVMKMIFTTHQTENVNLSSFIQTTERNMPQMPNCIKTGMSVICSRVNVIVLKKEGL